MEIRLKAKVRSSLTKCSPPESIYDITDQVKKFGVRLVFLFLDDENFAGVKRNAEVTIVYYLKNMLNMI